MWLIHGPFDSEQIGDEASQKTKLLKTGRVYGVGRHRDSALFVNNKKVSRQNGEFIIDEHGEKKVSNPAFVPKLSLRNNKSEKMTVTRGKDVFYVNPASIYPLESGDIVKLAGKVNVTVEWDSKVCFQIPGSGVADADLATCAAIGLKIVTKHSEGITHHITTNVTTPVHPSILLSLLNPSWIVNPHWLPELIRRANDTVTGLERTYDPPSEDDYHPVVDSGFARQHQNMAQRSPWGPNQNRQNLFKGIRFIFAVIGSGIGSSTKAISDVVTRGGASHQLINVEREAEEQANESAGSWGTILKKRKVILREGMHSGLVLVGDEGTMVANGIPREIKKTWEAMVEKAKRVKMRVIHPSLVAEAILKADVSLVDCLLDGDTDVGPGSSPDYKSLPDFIPSTHPEEPSQLQSTAPTEPIPPSVGPETRETAQAQTSIMGPSRRALRRRATSQTPAPELASKAMPMETEGTDQIAPLKKPLKRRAKTGGIVNEILGLDDTIAGESQSSQRGSQPTLPNMVPSTPARPGRLKRRAGTAAPSSQLLPELPAVENGEEPPLKKFKALFDESGQGLTPSIGAEAETYASGSCVIAETQLPAVMEEEEEPQSQRQARKRKSSVIEEEEPQSQRQARKRKFNVIEEEGMGAISEAQDAEGSSIPKKCAVESVNAVECSRKPDSQDNITASTKGSSKSTKTGAAPGKPDTDPSFLRAIASNKRGKRTEDDFDREFNQLRIAKPDINENISARDVVQWTREWDGLDDFEKDVGVRGNFMQIVELKVWKDDRNAQQERNMRRESEPGARLGWNGREDYKKFRRKMKGGPRELVKLIPSQQREYVSEAPGFDYRGNKQAHGFDEPSQSQSQDQNSHPVFTQTQPTFKSHPSSQPKAKTRLKPVYEELDENEEIEAEVGRMGMKRKGKHNRIPTQTGKKRQPLFEHDSEEDLTPDSTAFANEQIDDAEESLDMTLRTQTQIEKPTTRGTKRKVVLEEESDSDQGLTFGGFSKKVRKIR